MSGLFLRAFMFLDADAAYGASALTNWFHCCNSERLEAFS